MIEPRSISLYLRILLLRLPGDVSYRTIEVQIGAVAQGRLQYLEDPKDDKVLPFKVPTSEKWRD